MDSVNGGEREEGRGKRGERKKKKEKKKTNLN